MKVVNHRLCQDDGTPFEFIRSPNQSGAITPEYLISWVGARAFYPADKLISYFKKDRQVNDR